MSHNTWIHRVVRHGVRPLVGSRITPNHLTGLRLVTGIAATAAFAVGTPGWRAWGGAIFLVSLLLDRADGELARLGGKTSPWGHKFDLVSDAFCNAVVFVGIGFGLRYGDFGLWATAMGALAGAAIVTILWLTLRIEAARGERAGEIKGVAGFDPDDAMFVVPPIIWAGWPEALLVAAAIGAPVFAGVMYAILRRRQRNAG